LDCQSVSILWKDKTGIAHIMLGVLTIFMIRKEKPDDAMLLFMFKDRDCDSPMGHSPPLRPKRNAGPPSRFKDFVPLSI